MPESWGRSSKWPDGYPYEDDQEDVSPKERYYVSYDKLNWKAKGAEYGTEKAEETETKEETNP